MSASYDTFSMLENDLTLYMLIQTFSIDSLKSFTCFFFYFESSNSVYSYISWKYFTLFHIASVFGKSWSFLTLTTKWCLIETKRRWLSIHGICSLPVSTTMATYWRSRQIMRTECKASESIKANAGVALFLAFRNEHPSTLFLIDDNDCTIAAVEHTKRSHKRNSKWTTDNPTHSHTIWHLIQLKVVLEICALVLQLQTLLRRLKLEIIANLIGTHQYIFNHVRHSSHLNLNRICLEWLRA